MDNSDIFDDQSYREKVRAIFKNTSIDKSLVQTVRVRELPRYIFEWLLSHHVEDSGELTAENKKQLYDLIERHFPDTKNLELYKDMIIMDHEKLHILNKYQVTLDARREEYGIYFPFFANESRNVMLDPTIVVENKGLLVNGLWGIATIAKNLLNRALDINRPFIITGFSPVQIKQVKLEKFIEARKKFTLPEWVGLLINTMGLNHAAFPSVEEKMYLLTRLIPYAENNFNLVEMGPKGTGKSFLHKNISTHVHVIGGGIISRAELIFNIGTKKKGLLLTNDVVVFDDFSNIEIKGANEVIGKLKNYMADGYLDAGSFKEPSNASVVFMGNIALNEDGQPATDFYFRTLPKPMQESAFLDRIAAFIPGWILHPIRKRDYAQDYGLIGDWFSEILHSLRKKNFISEVENMIRFTGRKTRARDIELMKTTVSGLMKLLYPDGEMENEDWHLVAKYAVEMRQRVINQLGRIDPEYKNITLDYEVLD